jgi:hypothetical protein
MTEQTNSQATEAEIIKGTQVENVRPQNADSLADKPLQITRARYDSLTLYEVSEEELEIIERGTPDSIYLNFAIFLLSIASAFLISLLTGDFQNKQSAFTIFIVITVVGFLGGGFLLLLWLRTRSSLNDVIKRIKQRKK